MGLIDCRECGKIMSSSAAACPTCGRPNRSLDAAVERTMSIGNVVLTLLLVGSVICAVVWFAISRPLTPEEKCGRDGGRVTQTPQGRRLCMLPSPGNAPPKIVWLD